MNASLIDRYLFRYLTITTIVATLIISVVIWLIQALKFFEIAVNGGAPMGLFITLVLLNMPGIVTVVLPIILALVIAFVYNKLTVESELVVLRAAGLSQWRLARPAVMLGGIVAISVFLLNSFVAPLANERLKTLLDISRAQYSGVPINSGGFNALSDDLTIYVRQRDPNGDLRGILIYRNQDDGRPVALAAKRGVLAEGKNGPEIVLYDVKRQEVDIRTGDAPFNEARTASIDLGQIRDTFAKRWKEPPERTLIELFSKSDDERDIGQDAAFLAEANMRIASPFFALSLTAVALLALLGGHFDRRGQSRRIMLGAVGVILIQMAAIGLGSLSRRHGFVIPLLYLAGIVPIVITLAWFDRADKGMPPWREWLVQLRGRIPVLSRAA